MGTPMEKNPFKRQMVAVQRIGKDGAPDTSNFSVAGFEVTPDDNGIAEVPDWAAKLLTDGHGYKVVDADEARALEKARQAKAKDKKQPERQPAP